MKKQRNCYENKGVNGEIISYRFYYSGKDPITDQPKQYTKTWKVPKGLSHKEVELQKKKFEIEFINECEKKSLGLYSQEKHLTFEEYSTKWNERIMLRNEESFNYYERSKYALSIINQHLGRFYLNKITPSMIQNFIDYLCERTYTKEIVVVKKSIYELVDLKELKKSQLSRKCGIERHTLELASKVGSRVSMKTAKTISGYFKVPLTKYFEVSKEEVKYSKASNDGIKRILSTVLAEAKREQLIEHNYASREYIKPLTGTTKEKEIFTEEECREFVRCVLKEKNFKVKTTMAILIFLGLRRAEICGLSWSDIDFDKQTLCVRRNRVYTKTFGIQTKDTKTSSSKREIKMPNLLVNILLEYKEWYEEQKLIHGDLWEGKDSLFLRDDGKPMHPSSVEHWTRDFCLTNGLKLIPPHSIRHTCITMQIIAGVPLKVVSKRAGHSDEKITLSVYTHALKSQDDQAAEIYNNYLIG